MGTIKPIETFYNGYRFRSRLEARWAVFFDALNVKWEYEPEGFDLGDGIYYLPDFLLHGVDGRSPNDLWVEVKGEMTDADALKIRKFAKEKPIYVVGAIPNANTDGELEQFISDAWEDSECLYYSFSLIDGDTFAAHLGVNRKGKFELFGDDSNYLSARDTAATLEAFRKARQARFEHGEQYKQPIQEKPKGIETIILNPKYDGKTRYLVLNLIKRYKEAANMKESDIPSLLATISQWAVRNREITNLLDKEYIPPKGSGGGVSGEWDVDAAQFFIDNGYGYKWLKKQGIVS